LIKESRKESEVFALAEWQAGREQFTYEHHFVSEDEVYQRYLLDGFCSEGHLLNGKQIFVLTSLESTAFLSDVRTFWELWVSF